ncbi:uncharacterized lipoprotein YehR (DUF1307 family) [Hoyosella altamirensis]|uniref:Uncharacterized lipoprotein YehR (DUF1307 family) n=1 Tax=Hoyosella altamirensis TaxID=616997 RepID=A0A839RT74_9ACTN|nr:uncharacterized lipoprotein YehR (DUF1307 family) [Hoyosella altamirensis]
MHRCTSWTSVSRIVAVAVLVGLTACGEGEDSASGQRFTGP